jgi:hypothetical protein
MKRWNVVLFLSAFAFVMAQCGGDDGGSTGATPDPDEGKTVTKAVTAAEGGTIATASGTASLTIPAGALATDTEITLAVEAASGTETSVYNFGPDGTTFATPVDLSIKYDGTPGDDKEAVLAWYNGTEWEEVPGSTVAGDMVTGKISHFSKFSIILVGKDVVVVSECKSVAEEFSACGGDVEGTWKFKDVCMDDTVIGSNPFESTCPTATVEVEVEWDATITFNADNTYTQVMNSQSMTATYNVPVSCLTPHGGAAVCVSGEEGIFGEEATCAVESDICVCHSSNVSTSDDPNQSGTYAVEGNKLSINEADGGGPDEAMNYCRTGNLVVVEVIEEDTDEDTGAVTTMKMYMVLEKQ